MPSDMYTFADGSPRYGIRSDGQTDSSALINPILGTAAAQASAMDLVDLDIAAQFLPPKDMRPLFALNRTFGQELPQARQHVETSLGSSHQWLEAARKRGDGDTTTALPPGRSLVLGGVLSFLLVAPCMPLMVGPVAFLRDASAWQAVGAAAIAYVALTPVKALGRKFSERSGYKIREHVAAEADIMW